MSRLEYESLQYHIRFRQSVYSQFKAYRCHIIGTQTFQSAARTNKHTCKAGALRGVGGRGVPSTRIVRARSRRCQRRAERAAAPRRRVGYCRSDRWDLVPWPPAHAARCRRSSCSSQRAARRLPPSSQRLVRRSSRLGRTAGWGSQPPPRGCSAAAPTSIRAWRTTGRPGKIRTTTLRLTQWRTHSWEYSSPATFNRE